MTDDTTACYLGGLFERPATGGGFTLEGQLGGTTVRITRQRNPQPGRPEWSMHLLPRPRDPERRRPYSGGLGTVAEPNGRPAPVDENDIPAFLKR